MVLPSELVSQFVKVTKDEVEEKRESTVYGTIVENAGAKYVRLDGSDLLTPITSTAEMENGERVTVMIKNHTATVTGNITSPSARLESVKVIGDKVDQVEENMENSESQNQEALENVWTEINQQQNKITLMVSKEDLETYLRVIPEGVEIGKSDTAFTTLTSDSGFYIRHQPDQNYNSKVVIGVFNYRGLKTREIQLGEIEEDDANIVVRKTASGGWVWTDG